MNRRRFPCQRRWSLRAKPTIPSSPGTNGSSKVFTSQSKLFWAAFLKSIVSKVVYRIVWFYDLLRFMMPSPEQFAFASCFKFQTHFVVAQFCLKLCHACSFFDFTCVSWLLRPILTVLRDAAQHMFVLFAVGRHLFATIEC